MKSVKDNVTGYWASAIVAVCVLSLSVNQPISASPYIKGVIKNAGKITRDLEKKRRIERYKIDGIGSSNNIDNTKLMPSGVRGGVATSQLRKPVRDIVIDLAETFGRSPIKSNVNSHEEMAEKIYSSIQKIRQTGVYKGKKVSEDLEKSLKSFSDDGPSIETIKKYSHAVAKKYVIVKEKMGRVRPRHPSREKSENILRKLREQGVPRSEAIKEVEKILRHSEVEIPSHTAIKNWANEIFY